MVLRVGGVSVAYTLSGSLQVPRAARYNSAAGHVAPYSAFRSFLVAFLEVPAVVTIWKRKVGWLGLVLFVAIVAGAVYLGACLRGWGKYKAAALLSVALQEKPISFATSVDRDRFEIYKNTQGQLLTSRFVLTAALRNPEVAKLPVVRREQETGDPVVWLQKRLWVSFPGKAELMEVGIARHDPQEAVTLVNAVVEAYLHEVVNAEQDEKRLRLSEIDRAVTEKTAEVRTLRENLKRKYAEFGTFDTATLSLKQRLVLEDAGAARQELVQVKVELRRLKSDLASQKAAAGEPRPLRQAPRRGQGGETRDDPDGCQAVRDGDRYGDRGATGIGDRGAAEAEGSREARHAAADVAELQRDIKNAETVLAELAAERDKFRAECRQAPRVVLLIPAAVHQPGKPAEERARP